MSFVKVWLLSALTTRKIMNIVMMMYKMTCFFKNVLTGSESEPERSSSPALLRLGDSLETDVN